MCFLKDADEYSAMGGEQMVLKNDGGLRVGSRMPQVHVTQTLQWINISEFLLCKCEESALWGQWALKTESILHSWEVTYEKVSK